MHARVPWQSPPPERVPLVPKSLFVIIRLFAVIVSELQINLFIKTTLTLFQTMLLQLKSAEFRYADTTIFEDVNLDVNEKYASRLQTVSKHNQGWRDVAN